MAFSLNRVTLIGNIGRDPVTRTTQDGKKVLSFALATSERWKDKNTGETRERTEWHNVVVFAQPLISVIENYAHKGSRLMVEGSLHTRKWTDQSGVEKYTTEVVIQAYQGTIMLLDGRGGKPGDDVHGRDPVHMEESRVANFDVQHLDDEIPF